MPRYQPPSADVRRYCEERGYSSNVRNGGFHYLTESWRRTVALVEAGYPLLFYEFINDLDTRRIIDELAAHASDEKWKDVEAVLSSLDQRFLKATRPVSVCLYGASDEQKSQYQPVRDWYYFRVPTDLSRVPDPGGWWPMTTA